jgi:hypothetical protein
MQYMVRPVSLTVIGLYFIISALISILSLLFAGGSISWEMMGANPVIVMIFSTASSVVQLAAGVAILQQQKWGRTLLLFFVPLSIIISAFVFDAFREYIPLSVGFSVIFYGVIFYFLFRSDAGEYFAGTYTGPTNFQKAIRKVRRSQKNPSDLKQVFGVLFLIAAGFFLYMFVLLIGFSSEFSGLFIFTFMLLLPAVLLYIAGVFLWGKMRWMAVTGWVLIANGIISIISAVTYRFMMTMDLSAFLPSGEAPEPDQLQMLMQSNYLGIVIGVIGLVFLYYQIQSDHADAAELLADLEE